MYTNFDEKHQTGRDMAPVALACSTSAIPEAAREESLAAFDHTCLFFLGIPGKQFLEEYDADRIDPSTPHLAEVLDMLSFVR
jgi:hypothetical protein